MQSKIMLIVNVLRTRLHEQKYYEKVIQRCDITIVRHQSRAIVRTHINLNARTSNISLLHEANPTETICM